MVTMALTIDWTQIISQGITAMIMGFFTAAGIVIANRYTVRVLDKFERNGVRNNRDVDSVDKKR